jgi:hypothetical protein
LDGELMAHFAKIEDGLVTQVVVVDNAHESNGEAYLHSLGLEGEWVQTSYNANIRRKYAGIGDIYNRALDRFEPSSPYPSWLWDENAYAWVAPVPYPDDGRAYVWDEATQSWVLESSGS